VSRSRLKYDEGYLRIGGHHWRCKTVTRDGRGHWTCRNCGTEAVVAKVLGCHAYPPSSFDLPREVRALRCGDIVARQVMEA